MELSRFVKLTPEEATDYTCRLCKKILIEPHAIECCGIHVCEQCLENHFKEKDICPECQSETIKHIRYRPLKRRIDELQIFCSKHDCGCTETIHVREDKYHLEVCQYVQVECSLNCGKAMIRKDLDDHLANQCPKRSVPCGYCKEQGSYEEIKGPAHQDTCPDYPVGCPNKCSDGNAVKRKDLKMHSSVCPQELIPCIDCKDSKRRHLMEDHRSTCPKRQTPCEECGKIGAHDEITGAHVKECPERVIGCPNKCDLEGSELVKKKDLKEHTEKCPLEPVSCLFLNVGCNSQQLVRQDLNGHFQSNLQHHMEMFIAAYNKLDKEHVKVKSELAKFKRAQCGMEESLNKMKESISYGLTVIYPPKGQLQDEDLQAAGIDCIKSALNPKVNTEAENTFSFHVPKMTEGKWSSQPFYVLDEYKVCLIFEKEIQNSADQQSPVTVTVSLGLMVNEDQHHKKTSDYPPELTLRTTLFIHPLVPSETKPTKIDFPINELKSNLMCKKSFTQRIQGSLTGKVNLHYLCQMCNYSKDPISQKCTYCEHSSTKK